MEIEKSLNERLNFSYDEYSKVFKSKFTSIDSTLIKQDLLISYYDTLTSYYAARNYEPLFIKSFEDEDFVYSLIMVLEKVGEHGLNPEQYHFSSIRSEFSKAIDTLTNNSRFSHLANTELLVSDAILNYSIHLRYGEVNPKEIFPDDYFLPIDDSSKGDLFQPLRQEKIFNYLNDIQPKSNRYKNLQAALKYYNNFKDLKWSEIPIPDKKIELGARDSLIALVIQRLIALEYVDTSKFQLEDPFVYNSAIVEYVKRFQRNYGLNDDGVIGKNTIERLNTAPQQYIDKIKINLERFRWNDYPDTAQYVIVNIPDFRLFIVDSGKVVYNTKVCTGRKRPANYENQLKRYKKTKKLADKPEDWETPIMSSEFSYLVLNPTWSVPESIIREEIFQKVSEDSSYLLSHNFKIYLDTTEIDPMEVKLSDLSSEEIQYKIVQDPGAGNALGKIKFLFNNRFGVYLHDTPTRPPFSYSNRAVSHGCVRVEKPMPLAEFLLKGNPKWNMDFLKIEIGQKVEDKSKISEYKKVREKLRRNKKDNKTTEILLSKKIPLYIDYYTAWVDEDGTINFRDDVYNKDKILLEQLLSKNQL